MKTYPIIMSGPMVRALLDGRKHQTRRLVTSQWANLKMHHDMGTRCFLWVRETWQTGMCENGPCITYAATPGISDIDAWDGDDFGAGPSFNYQKCPGATWHTWIGDLLSGAEGSWRPSLHQSRWASRITLEVTDVRLQHLRDITEEDAVAEGATSRPNCYGYGLQAPGWSMDWSKVGKPSHWEREGKPLREQDVCLGSAKSAFGSFINELHGGKNWNCKAEPSLWDQNPEVFTISFRVHHQNIDQFVKAAA